MQKLAKLPPIDKTIHFIGIGGIGMSALALIVKDWGYNVSGSDSNISARLEDLRERNIQIFSSQASKNIEVVTQKSKNNVLVIISSAIKDGNQELEAAKEAGLEIWHRSDLLAALMGQKQSVVIAGSHGKTTTSTIVTTLLALTGKDPTAVIGGQVPFYQSNAHSGKGKIIVAEGDESDGSVIKLKANLGVITNLEFEHADHYKNLKELIETMKIFANGCEKILANYDCPNLQSSLKDCYWWSTKQTEEVDFAALPISIEGDKSIVRFFEKGKFIDDITIGLPGIHNLSNAIAAIATCRLQGVSFKQIKNNIMFIERPSRRFEYKGEWKNRQFVDDYAHHPTEIESTIKMANKIITSKQTPFPKTSERLVVVFQPHRFSRTNIFIKDFARCLSESKLLILSPTYAAGEDYIEKASISSIAKEIKKIKPSLEIYLAKNLQEVVALLKENSKRKDLILTMGAGDINNVWKLINKKEEIQKCPELKQAA